MSNDRIGGSVHEAELYWWNVVSQEALSLNKVSDSELIKELEDMESTRDLRIVSGIVLKVSNGISES